MSEDVSELIERAATARRILVEYEAWEMPAPPPDDPMDHAWTAQVIGDLADALNAALSDKRMVDELLAASVEDYNIVLDALKPFADAAEDLVDDNSYRDHDNLWETPAAMGLTHGDLRRARSALKREPS